MNKKYVKYTILIILSILIIPLIIKIFIIENNFISKGSNDGWLSFWGSYLGGTVGAIVTLIVLWVTRKDTRKIQTENKNLQEKLINLQEKIIEIEQENQLKGSRTIYSESSMQDYLTMKSNKEFFKGDYILKNEHYKNIEKTIKKQENYEKCEYIISKPASEWLDWLRGIGDLNYKIIKNVGGNNMYSINIKLIGEWYMPDDIKVKDELDFRIDCIEKERSVLIPLFKLDDTESNIVQFGPSKMQVTYETGMLNKRERITVDTQYSTNYKNVNSKVTIDKVENYEIMDFNFTEYSIIR